MERVKCKGEGWRDGELGVKSGQEWKEGGEKKNERRDGGKGGDTECTVYDVTMWFT